MNAQASDREINRAFLSSGLQRQGYTYRAAINNPAILTGLICSVLAEQRRQARAMHAQGRETHQKGATL